MDEQTFDQIGRLELADLEEKLDPIDPDDIDLDTIDGVLTLTLRDGTRVVINTHRAARQIWMAAVSSAWHFDPPSQPGAGWRTSSNEELRDVLIGIVRKRIGLELAL